MLRVLPAHQRLGGRGPRRWPDRPTAGSAARARRRLMARRSSPSSERRRMLDWSCSGAYTADAAAGPLGRVHGHVGPAGQRLGVDGVVGVDGDADAGVDLQADPAEVEGLLQRGADPRRAPPAPRRGRPASVSSTANSSPPEPGDHVGGRRPAAPASRRLSSMSSRSPWSWPRASLISLNWSRSMTSSATGSRVCDERRSDWRSRSVRCERLGSPVSPSCRAWRRSTSAAVTCSVTSCSETPTEPPGSGNTLARVDGASRGRSASNRRSSKRNPSPERITSASASQMSCARGLVEPGSAGRDRRRPMAPPGGRADQLGPFGVHGQQREAASSSMSFEAEHEQRDVEVLDQVQVLVAAAARPPCGR